MKPIDPSKYRRPVTIQQMGSSPSVWTDALGHIVMVAVTPQGSTLEHPELRSHKVELRYRPTPQVAPGMRILDGSRILYIRSVADVEERHVEWQLKCYEPILDLTADIQRNQSSTLDIGQTTETWASILTNGPVPCGMMAPSSALAQQYAELIGVQQVSIFRFTLGQDVQPADRIVTQSTTWTVHAQLFPESFPITTDVFASKIG